MDFSAESKKIVATVRWVCDTLKCPELFDKITIEWNSRFTRRMGDAEWKRVRGIVTEEYGIVRFSRPLWPRADETQRNQTVIHEVCHIVKAYKYPQLNPGRRNPHGREWKHLMRLCGITPKRTHKVDRTGLARHNTRTKYRVACKCRELLIGPTRYRRMKSGVSSYACQLCGGKIHPIGVENIAANNGE